jgi:hypothetical protein
MKKTIEEWYTWPKLCIGMCHLGPCLILIPHPVTVSSCHSSCSHHLFVWWWWWLWGPLIVTHILFGWGGWWHCVGGCCQAEKLKQCNLAKRTICQLVEEKQTKNLLEIWWMLLWWEYKFDLKKKRLEIGSSERRKMSYQVDSGTIRTDVNWLFAFP